LLAIGGAVGALGGFWLVCWLVLGCGKPPTEGEIKQRAPLNPQIARAASKNPRGYLGINSCEKCHSERVKEFKETRHYLACMLPDPSQMPSEFNSGQGKLNTSDPNLHFEMVKEGDDYIQKTIRTNPGSPARETKSVVALVYGQGGTADQVYFGWRDNRLFEFPVARLLPQNEWGSAKIDRNGSGDFAREVTPRCLECHNVWFKQTPGVLNEYDRQDALLGVTCEKCHGPGRDHVAWHKANPDAKSGKEIVHPGSLSRENLMAVCGQCHSNAPKYAAEPFTFKPGEPLDRYFKTLHSQFPEDDHVANQDTYLRQSKCYQQSETMTCITCHNPHHPEEHATPVRQQTCLKCHAADKCTDQPQLPTDVRDNCIGCHMPHVNKIQVHFFTSKDAYVPPAKRYEHRIGIYPLQRQEMILESLRKKNDAESRKQAQKLGQELASAWIAEGDKLRDAYRILAAIDAFRQAERILPGTDSRQKLAQVIEMNSRIDSGWFQAAKEIQEKRFAEAAKSLEDVLAIKPNLALAHGKLGAVYASLGQKEKAREHLEAVAKFDPDESYGESMLGWLAHLEGQHDEALEHYHRAEEMEPRNAKVKFNKGLSHLGLEQWEDARVAFLKVVELDPKNPGAFQGLSRALRGQGQHLEALKNAQRAAELTRYESADILLSLADAYADAGRLQEAQSTASRALAAAQGGDRQLIEQIVARISEFQKRGSGTR
jgi:predicted CXXCH cytochrome family protein